jgi:hypothetical protein
MNKTMPGWLADLTVPAARDEAGVRPDGRKMTAGDRLNVFLMYQAVMAGAETPGPRASALRPGAGPASKHIFGLP